MPQLFRINVEVGDLAAAAERYASLFGVPGRLQAGSRCYFTCGPVTLQVLDVSSSGAPHPAAKALYFTVHDLDAVHARAQALGWLSKARPRRRRRRHHRAPLGRALVLRGGLVAQPALLRRGGHDLPRVKPGRYARAREDRRVVIKALGT